jgi:hypothetical protein
MEMFKWPNKGLSRQAGGVARNDLISLRSPFISVFHRQWVNDRDVIARHAVG